MDVRVDSLAPGKALVVVSGVLDWNATPGLKKTFDELFDNSVYHIAVDTAGVSYISSSAFGVLNEAMNMARTAAGRLVFVSPSEAVREIFQLLGAMHLLKTADSKEAALKLLK